MFWKIRFLCCTFANPFENRDIHSEAFIKKISILAHYRTFQAIVVDVSIKCENKFLLFDNGRCQRLFIDNIFQCKH